MPATIPADGSRAVETEIMAFLARVPNGSTVRFPAGAVYGQNLTIIVPDRRNLVIDGNGATFKKLLPSSVERHNNASWRIAGGDGIVMKNMVIVGAYIERPRGTPSNGGTWDHGISLWGTWNVSILDCRIANVEGEFITADPDIRQGSWYAKNRQCRNILIDRLIGKHAGRQGVASTASDGFTLSNSSLTNIQGNGVDIEIDVAGELNRNVRIINNVIDGHRFCAIILPVGGSPEVGNVLIQGNVIKQPPDTCYAPIVIGHPAYTLQGISIKNNTILTHGDGIVLTNVNSGEVSGNIITNVNPGNNSCISPANYNPPYPLPIRQRGTSAATIGLNKNIGFTPPPAGRLIGRVSTPAGAALVGIAVTVSPNPAGAVNPVYTNSAGYFTFSGLSPDRYALTPSGGGLHFAPVNRTATLGTTDVTGQNFIGEPGYKLMGRIATSTGVAVANVPVTRSGQMAPVYTNSAGYYTFANVPNGTYTVTASQSGYGFLPQARAVTINRADIANQNFTRLNGYKIIGRISTSNGTALANVQVTLSGRATPIPTNSAGYYTFSDVPAGSYTVTASQSGKLFTPATRTVEVKAAHVVGQNFVGDSLERG